MVTAYTYPFLNIFWTMLIFFAWIIWFWLLITVFADIFRRHDASGWVKAFWILFVVILPFLGVLIYMIAEGKGMAERSAEQQQKAMAQTDDYIRSVASPSDSAEQIAKAKQLLDSGAITATEYDTLKAKALGRRRPGGSRTGASGRGPDTPCTRPARSAARATSRREPVAGGAP